MSTPPPPYSSQPPPAYTRSRPQRKSRRAPRPPRPARPSSRELLTKALHRALHAVELDSSGSDLPAAIAAYDEAIALLQRVITFRSRHPGRASELERVTEIHDKYADRVRELCRNRRVPLPDHVPPTPVPNPAGCTPPPLPTTSPLRLPLPLPPCQDPAPSFSRPSNDVLLERLKLKRRSSPTDDETEWVPELSPSSSTSSALESLLPLPPHCPR
ncbi:hypothetical protein F5148DRAFT_601182 [Russula earlei]|uniref:Uncharacterized protein n=1 Tax=Russula earlei TaxID=71964 RepID=A0ACC0TVW5_9AGAM|nr:hypothetical protein F5148DRAFT_601182 [Russula earlei]